MNKNITNGNEDFHEYMKTNLDFSYRIKYIKYKNRNKKYL